MQQHWWGLLYAPLLPKMMVVGSWLAQAQVHHVCCYCLQH
jgi:hypothetical protein